MVIVGAQHGRSADRNDGSGQREANVRCSATDPHSQLAGEPGDCDLFRRALIFKRASGSPPCDLHRNAAVAGVASHRAGWSGWAESWCSLMSRSASYARIIARNGAEYFTARFRQGLPTSIDELEWQSPFLTGLEELGLGRISRPIPSSQTTAIRPGLVEATCLVPFETLHISKRLLLGTLISSGHLVSGTSGGHTRGPANTRGARAVN